MAFAARIGTSECPTRRRKLSLIQIAGDGGLAIAALKAYYTTSQQFCKLVLFKGKPAVSEESCDRDVEGW